MTVDETGLKKDEVPAATMAAKMVSISAAKSAALLATSTADETAAWWAGKMVEL